jgi:hypothetical protein
MKITIESTSKLVNFVTENGAVVQARIWEGHTESGIPVHCFVTRLAPTIPRIDPRQAEFQRELLEQSAPSAEVAVYPLRMIL